MQIISQKRQFEWNARPNSPENKTIYYTTERFIQHAYYDIYSKHTSDDLIFRR